jgi:hypothetical protein
MREKRKEQTLTGSVGGGVTGISQYLIIITLNVHKSSQFSD